MLYFHQGKLIPVTKKEAEDSYYRPLLQMPDDVEVVLQSNGCQPQFYKDNFTQYYYNGKWNTETRDVFPIKNSNFTKVVWTKDLILTQITDKGCEISNVRSMISKLEKQLVHLESEYNDLLETRNLQRSYLK